MLSRKIPHRGNEQEEGVLHTIHTGNHGGSNTSERTSGSFLFSNSPVALHPPPLCLHPPLHLLYHGCISSCVMVEPERGKGSRFEVAVVIAGFINSHWMSRLWMHHYQTAWLHSNCLPSEWAKTACRGKYMHNLHTQAHFHTHKHTHTHTHTHRPTNVHQLTRTNLTNSICNLNSHARQE